MAKFTITYSCGHEGRVDISGPEKSRKYKAESMSQQLCPDCWRAQRREAAEDKATDLGLPDLMGTEKQIEWAMQLRIKAIEKMTDAHAKAVAGLRQLEYLGGIEGMFQAGLEKAAAVGREVDPDKFHASIEKQATEFRTTLALWQRLRTETSAKWFIDNR